MADIVHEIYVHGTDDEVLEMLERRERALGVPEYYINRTVEKDRPQLVLVEEADPKEKYSGFAWAATQSGQQTKTAQKTDTADEKELQYDKRAVAPSASVTGTKSTAGASKIVARARQAELDMDCFEREGYAISPSTQEHVSKPASVPASDFADAEDASRVVAKAEGSEVDATDRGTSSRMTALDKLKASGNDTDADIDAKKSPKDRSEGYKLLGYDECFVIEPMGPMDWKEAGSLVENCQEMKDASQDGPDGPDGPSFILTPGYKSLREAYNNAQRVRGGWMIKDNFGNITAMCFGEAGWNDKPYEWTPNLGVTSYMDNIQKICDFSPVWAITGIWVKDTDEYPEALKMFFRYFGRWSSNYLVVAIMPTNIIEHYKIRKNSTYKMGYNRHVTWVIENVGKYNGIEYSVINAKCFGFALNTFSCEALQDASQIITELSKEYQKDLARAKACGGTDESFVRGIVLRCAYRPVRIDGVTIGHNYLGAQLKLVEQVYGICPEQALVYATKKLGGLVLAEKESVRLCDTEVYARRMLKNEYLRTVAYNYKIQYKALKEAVGDRNCSGETLDKLARQLKSSGYGLHNRNEEQDKVSDKLEAGWRGFHDEHEPIPDVLLNRGYAEKLSGWLIIKAWDAMFDFSRHLGKLKWFEHYVEKSGVSCDKYCSYLRLNIEAILRGLQYDIDVPGALRLIAKSYKPLNSGTTETVRSLLSKNGITERDWIIYKRDGAYADLEPMVKERCKQVDRVIIAKSSGADDSGSKDPPNYKKDRLANEIYKRQHPMHG